MQAEGLRGTGRHRPSRRGVSPDSVQRVIPPRISAARSAPIRHGSCRLSLTRARALLKQGGAPYIDAATARHLAGVERGGEAPALMQRLEDLLPLRVEHLRVIAGRRHLAFTLRGRGAAVKRSTPQLAAHQPTVCASRCPSSPTRSVLNTCIRSRT